MRAVQLPYNIEAEEAVLGAILINDEVMDDIVEFLNTDDFYRRNHRIIFSTMLELHNEQSGIDNLTVVDRLSKKKLLGTVGGIAFVTALANTVPTTANTSHYAKIVKEKAVMRNIIHAAEEIIYLSCNSDCNLDELTDKAEAYILQATQNCKTNKIPSIQEQTLEALTQIEDVYNNKGKLLGLSTGINDIDHMITGLKKSDFIIIAGRPSMGKTAFALNIASFVALEEKKSVAVFSLEMSSAQLLQRIISSWGIVKLANIKTGRIR